MRDYENVARIYYEDERRIIILQHWALMIISSRVHVRMPRLYEIHKPITHRCRQVKPECNVLFGYVKASSIIYHLGSVHSGGHSGESPSFLKAGDGIDRILRHQYE